MPIIKISVLIVAGIVSAGQAQAAVSIIGGGMGHACYKAAEVNAPLRPSIATCSAALDQETQSSHDRASTFVNRGIIYMQARNITAALADYDAALRIDPELAEAYINKGIALVNLGGRDAEAVELLTKGLDRKPLHPEVAFYTRAVAHEMIGATREAYEDYRQAAELAPAWSEPAAQLQRFSIVCRPTAPA